MSITTIEQDPLHFYIKNRPEHYNYVKKVIIKNKGKFKIISAPVKVGKRSFVIISKLLEPQYEHIFLSALHRKADLKQRDEYKEHGITVFSSPKEITNECSKFIDKSIKDKIIIHLDELDFGCGDKQNISKIVKKYYSNPKVELILYSATSEVAEIEFLSPNKIEDFITLPKFKPSSLYYGIKNYIKDGLMFEAKEFFNYNFDNEILSISEQGVDLINQLMVNKNKNIGIIRLSGNVKDDSGNSVSRFDIFKENKDEIQEVLNSVQEDATKFYEKGNKAAGTRVRKAMQQIKSLAQDVRVDVSEKNKENA